MKKRILNLILLISTVGCAFGIFADGPLQDLASLQRGARVYMNYCGGCHSLKFIRYDAMARGIGIVDESGTLLADAVKSSLMFTGDKLSDPIVTALSPQLAEKWFGIVPPDLSLVTRARGANWVSTYLRSFYRDEAQPWGVNNTLYPGAAMPHVLEEVSEGATEAYDEMVADLVNFLSYVGEPTQRVRLQLGGWVLIFLSVFLLLSYLLYREYWKDLKK